MNILRELQEGRVSKDQTRVMKKTRLPTEKKTKKHRCSQCPSEYAQRYPISKKEVRWLCDRCVSKFKAQLWNEVVTFVKAGKLSII